MVDQISSDYAHRPVVFLENYYYDAPGDRIWRVYYAIPGSSYSFPLIILDSGNLWSMGPTDYSADYRALVETALARPPEGSIRVQRQRVNDTFEFTIQVTNNTGVTLSTANHASVYAIVFEDSPDGISRVTDRYVREASYGSITSLADGASDTFDLVVDLTGMTVDWDALHSVVLVDYRPSGSTGPYDMIQAAFQP